MSEILDNPAGPTNSPAPLPAAGVRRTPFYLESQGQPLFAWLHRPAEATAVPHGVVICPPIGHEQLHTHRSLRHLADAVAAARFPVLRFDYHGTGDSAGSDEDHERVATWLGNIRDARRYLEKQLGCRRVSLVGLRVGATLAAQAAADEEVEGLLLWAPVVKGRSYVREMKALCLTAAGDARPPAEDLEAAGFVLTEQTAVRLSRLDLLQSRPRCRRALIVARDDTPNDSRLLDHLKAVGIEAEQTTQPGYADMLAEPHYNKVPREAIDRAVAWLLASNSPEHRTEEESFPAVVTLAPSAGTALLPREQLGERVLQISQAPDLFGILSESPAAAAAHLPFIVLLNAGSSYRVGPNRLYVSLARRLAARGFRCLRMDLAGLGDSLSPDQRRENDPYPATAFRDIDLTLNFLRTQLGGRRAVLMGLCSGAYAAFQSAAQLTNPVLDESVLINPLTFHWREGMSLEATPALQLKSFQEGVTSAWRPGKWLRLLSGRSEIGIRGALRILLGRWKLGRRLGRPASVGGRATTREDFPSHPLREDLPGDLGRAVQAGRHLACFFSRSDPGYGILTLQARRTVDELCRAGRMSVQFIDDADHTFSRRDARHALAEAIGEHLSRRYLRPADGPSRPSS